MKSVEGAFKMIRGEGIHRPLPPLGQADYADRHVVLDEETHDLRSQDRQERLKSALSTHPPDGTLLIIR